MNISGKWLARAGAILVMLGFILPTMTVSCSGLPGLGQSLSLLDLAGKMDQLALSLVPFGAFVGLVLTLLPAGNRSIVISSLWGQVAGFGVGILSVAITLISINSQINSLYAFDVTPQFGLFILTGGYVLAVIGVIFQWQELNRYKTALAPSVVSPPPPIYQPNNQPAPPRSPGARLQTVKGTAPQPIIPILSDNFMIGRGSDNDLQLPDMKVSRQHAYLRFAQGAWFIQDRESAGGTLVNDQPIQAIRLSPGDRITIGDETFIFYEQRD